MLSAKQETNQKKKQIRRRPRSPKDRSHKRSRKTGYKEIGRKTNNNSFKTNIAIQRKHNPALLYQTKMLLGIYITFPQRTKLNLDPKFNYFQSQIRKDNFVSFEKYCQGSVAFVGNPRSLTTVLEQLREKQKKDHYTSDEMLNLVLVYVDEQKLYSPAFEKYLKSFWVDILRLCKHPNVEAANQHGLNLEDDSMDIDMEPYDEASPKLLPEIINDSQSQYINHQYASTPIEPTKRVLKKKRKQKARIEPVQKSNKHPEQIDGLRQALGQDDTLLAHFIAGYIHCSCELSGITVGH